MAKYQSFEELPIWQEAVRLYHCVQDLLEEPALPLSSGFRNQPDRAALSVSNNIAEGFERVATRELLGFLAIARGSAGEVRSMMAAVKDRPKLRAAAGRLGEIRGLAESCARQLTAWARAIENSPVQGKRHFTSRERESRHVVQTARDYRTRFLQGLKPDHPLYHCREARLARGETVEE